jgi:hypothetical protein
LFTVFGNQFVDPNEILFRESLLFEMATPSGNVPSSMGQAMPCWNSWKTKANLQVSVFSDLLDGLLIGQAKPLLDEQRSKRQTHWLRRGASRGVELRSVCSFQRFPWIRDEMSIQRLSESSVLLKGTWNSSIESWPLWCIRYICGAQRLQQSSIALIEPS